MTRTRLFTGLDSPSHAQHFDAAFVSISRLKTRKSDFVVADWIMDSSAFTTLDINGRYLDPPEVYAEQVRRWGRCGNLLAAVSQDYMCEPFMLAKTGLTVDDHQRLTIERYDAIVACDTGVYIMPVLQGYAPQTYVDHIRQYGDRLDPGMWVGVGSVCKRNANIQAIEDVLLAIKSERPDLRLHGFGIKATALSSGLVQHLLYTADSMAWSYAARREGRNQHDWREAKRWGDKIKHRPIQMPMFTP